ncbi:MAG: aryl-sulfate sulfotransferase [Elusimicrobia bacterium]|nr:aryl-sulfate sulfotransferase [Elusimicrobiota bacterium]
MMEWRGVLLGVCFLGMPAVHDVFGALHFGLTSAVKKRGEELHDKVQEQRAGLAVSAGSDQSVSIASLVTLSGSAVDQGTGGVLTYLWTQTAGPAVTINSSNTVTTTFTPAEASTYTFQLAVSQGNLTGADAVNVLARGIQSGNYYVDIYYQDRVSSGTILFYDQLESGNNGLLEVNMAGQTVWDYRIPSAYLQTSTIGMDVEKLANGNYLFFTGNGIYEINSSGVLQSSYSVTKISHDAQRLPNGNTLYNYGKGDQYGDAQMTMINSTGGVVWQWYAKDHPGYYTIPSSTSTEEFTHANAVIWRSTNSFFIDLRNLDMTLEVDRNGDIIWLMDWSVYGGDVDPHEPDILSDGNMLICLQKNSPYVAVEINTTTKQAVWTYANTRLRTARDCDRLGNGDTMIVAVDTGGTLNSTNDDYSVMLEVTSGGDIVWRMTLNTVAASSSPGYFFKAERLPPDWTKSTTAD